MVGGTSKVTNWFEATKAAEKHPEGELVGVHGQTLRSMEKAGRAYRRGGKWYLVGKGPVEEPVEEPKIEETVVPSEEPPDLNYLAEEPRRGPARASFNTALNVLLDQENISGTKWAIEQIREIAEKKDDSLGAGLHELANQLEDRLGMRAADLTLKD